MWAQDLCVQTYALDAMAWSLIFLLCGECHCAPCHGKWNCMSRKFSLLAAKQIFNHIVLAIAKSAEWSAFKILSLNHSPWHTCTDISGKLWFGTCVLLVVFFSTRDRKSNVHYPLTQQVQALMLWAELRLLLRKMVPASSPDIPVAFLGPALVLQS